MWNYIERYNSPLGKITLVSDGKFPTGYAGGMDRKIELLKIEREYQNFFYIPKKGTAL